ncbi:peptide methionine sulfoxide reductase-like isoform X2 [Leptotrombidium deliense]|uniref:peptide-methionine (S)-S-oxide reductase n=1 Tax=Leptotrombidium deliense TaxID=299467 RepID=A0A443SDV5_9ACAR|nr:peptide methionine sulfoxide reductase-like isoform X2 [Leptotrombidium deliense]
MVTKEATFGVACFWISEAILGSFRGVVRTRTGFCGSVEAVNIDFDPKVLKYERLISQFWDSHDCTYGTKIIYFYNEEQKRIAEQVVKEKQTKQRKSCWTKIVKFSSFKEAGDNHQKHYLRRCNELFKSLNLDGKTLIESPVACKLNAYVAGIGTLEQFESEHKEWGLNETQVNVVRKIVRTESQ